MEPPPQSISHSSSIERGGYHLYEGWIRSEKEKAEEALIAFDANPEYGPCKGIGRLLRWENALKLGLNPPMEIPELISKTGLNDSYLEKYLI